MRPIPAYVVSLGCPKTRVDTERFLAALGPVKAVDDPSKARLIFVNTCGFIAPAVQESAETLLDAAQAAAQASKRARGKRPLVVAAGCLVSRYGQETLAAELPEVDLWLALDGMAQWPELVLSALAERGDEARAPVAVPRRATTPAGYAYLKIAEGCGNACTFCTIPAIRGRLASAPMQALLDEARALVDQGVPELVLVAQDLTAWGRDLDGPERLADLAAQLARIEGLSRLRLMYLYPAGLTDDFLARLADVGPPLVPYFDIPLQHAHPDILRAMGRPFATDPRRAIERVRARFSGAALRTSLIVGFPGEREEHLKALLEFVAEIRFHSLGVFAYQAEEGTAAALMEGQVDPAEREERRDRVMELQREISAGILAGYVGQELDVVIDEPSPEWPGLFVGRTWFQAPEVDGVTYVSGPGAAESLVARALIQDSQDYDLSALIE
jgi:tRNA-2-methylthio-N6-dimethylallyladenosine synthase/ribosomal protein S12 methylthiotransferase